MVSAAGWVNKNVLLIASETNLFLYDLNTRVEKHLIDLEKDNLKTRSNDGRSDPWGGFWIGTMGKNCEPDAGAIYRYFEGKLKLIISKLLSAIQSVSLSTKNIVIFLIQPRKILCV